MIINNSQFKVIKDANKKTYTDLKLFKEQIEIHTVNHRPFSMHKSKINTYRLVFLGLAALYVTFAIVFFYFLSPYMTNFILGSYSFILKNVICAACIFASLLSIGLSYCLSAEKEATYYIYKKTKAQLKRLYQRNISKTGFKRFFTCGEKREYLNNFNQAYHETLDKVYHFKDETIHIIERILSSDGLDRSKKEHLLNQALLEMHDKMNEALYRFKTSDSIRLLNSF